MEKGCPEKMKLSYKKLWVMLVERDLKKTEFAKNAKISSACLAKIGSHPDIISLFQRFLAKVVGMFQWDF